MGKKEEIKTVNGMVEDILVKHPKARNSDNYLYIQVIKKVHPKASQYALDYVFANLKELGLPCYETVSRVRRKIQSEHPELWSDKTIKKYREQAEKDFEDYARS